MDNVYIYVLGGVVVDIAAPSDRVRVFIVDEDADEVGIGPLRPESLRDRKVILEAMNDARIA